MHKVHGPALIQRMRHRQRFRLLAHQSFARLDAQVRLQLPVYAIHALVVPAKAFDVAQIQEAQAGARIALAVSQLDQPIGNNLVLCRALGAIPMQVSLTPKAAQADLTVMARSRTARMAISRR